MTEIPLADLPDRYGFIDLASGKKGAELKRTRARSAIVVVAQDWLDRVFVLKAWAKRCSTDTLIDEIYRTHDQYQLKSFGCEANAMQSLFTDAIQRDARLRGKDLPIRPVYQPTRVDKDWRIRTRMEPLVKAGKLFMRQDMTELTTEIAGFPLHPLKDCLDALASACSIMPVRATKPEESAGDEAYLDYLRKTGAPSWYISHAARQREALRN